MANLIIKSSADNLVIQGSDASPAITVGATGTTTFAENMTLSGTANNLGTITSATKFPRGHVINYAGVRDETISSSLGTTSTSYADTGITVPITAVASSTNSFFRVSFFSSMVQSESNSEGRIDIMMTTTNTATYAVAESITNSTYPLYFHPSGSADSYLPLHIVAYCGLETEMGLPATKSTWAIGDTLHFRIFFKRGTGDFNLVHNASTYSFSVEEVAR